MEKMFKRLLSLAVALFLVLGMVPAAALVAQAAPVLPTATVTELDAESLGLTFAMNFLADEATDEQLEYYGTWPADYVLSTNKDIVFNANGTADGWLSGQYDGFGSDWVNVPDGDVTLKADEPIRVMEYAMELMGYEQALTYNDIYTLVQDFNCGLYLDEEFLAANPDLEVTLELRMYNPENSEESYAIGESYTFEAPVVEAPELPTATVTMLDAESLGLTFAMNFLADEATDEQLEYYGTWPADYILTSNKDIVFDANGGSDGFLSGQYTAWSTQWINIPFEPVTLPANTPVPVMKTAMEMMDISTPVTYDMIYNVVQSFNCGLFLDEEFLAANPDLEVTLELRMYNPENENESYAIGETYEFSAAPKSEIAKIGSVVYATLQEAVSAAKAGDTIELIDDVVLTEPLVIPSNVAKRSTQTTTGDVEIDLAGQTISQSEECTAHYGMITNYGNLTITDSVGGGKISFTDTGAGDPNFGWGSYTIINYGTLTVNGGTIENLSTQNPGNGQKNVHMYCAIQQSAGSTTINDGTISNPTYRSVRVNKGELVINGGKFVGQVWLQPNQGDVTMTITGGKFRPSGNDGSSVFMTNEGENYTVSEAQITGGTFNTKIGVTNADALPGVIYGGTFTEAAKNGTNAALIADGYAMVANSNGMYGVEPTEKPALPTATATKVENDRLTFAMNFVADEATLAQQAYYGPWYADFVLTVNKDVTFNADGGADGYLSGQYDAWSENWVDVPFGKGDVTLKAGEGLQIMKFAAELMGKTGLRYTYQEVFNKVKDFDCGVYFTDEFLAANPDLEVTLELRIYNPADETENYLIGETHVFYLQAPELPTAKADDLENDRLTFAMFFEAEEATAAQLDYYGPWYADFVLTVNKDVAFNADGGADGFLSGFYEAYSENWVDVPYGKGNVELKAGEELQIMKFAAELMGKTGLRYTYKEVYEIVKRFECGVFFEDAFLAANPDLEVTLELRIYNPADETESYLIGETYVFTLTDNVAENVQTGEQYATVTAALTAAQEGETVRLLKNVEGEKAESLILILNNRTLDLNGYTLEATNVVAVTGGAKIEDSSEGTGLLKVAKNNLTLPGNDQLPIWIAEESGYRFATVAIRSGIQENADGSLTLIYYFTDALDGELKSQLANVAENDLQIKIRVTYQSTNDNEAVLDLIIPDDKVVEYSEWPSGQGYFATTIRGLNKFPVSTLTPYICYGTIELTGADCTHEYTPSTTD